MFSRNGRKSRWGSLDIIKSAHEKAINILKENIDKLHELAHFLLEKETITGEEFMDILNK